MKKKREGKGRKGKERTRLGGGKSLKRLGPEGARQEGNAKAMPLRSPDDQGRDKGRDGISAWMGVGLEMQVPRGAACMACNREAPAGTHGFDSVVESPCQWEGEM